MVRPNPELQSKVDAATADARKAAREREAAAHAGAPAKSTREQPLVVRGDIEPEVKK